MKTLPIRRFLPAALGALVIAAFPSACSKSKFDCETQSAVMVTLIDTEGDCAFSGTIEFEGRTSDMVCEVRESTGLCTCSGGKDTGEYRIKIKNLTTGFTDTALQEVTELPSPDCYERDTLERFTPIDGPGGAGGANDE